MTRKRRTRKAVKYYSTLDGVVWCGREKSFLTLFIHYSEFQALQLSSGELQMAREIDKSTTSLVAVWFPDPLAFRSGLENLAMSCLVCRSLTHLKSVLSYEIWSTSKELFITLFCKVFNIKV